MRHRPNLFTRRGRVLIVLGKKEYLVGPKRNTTEYAAMLANSAEHPQCVGRVGERNYWLFRGTWHWDNEQLPSSDVKALLLTRAMRRESELNRAREYSALGSLPQKRQRMSVPSDVRAMVFQRDGGRCVDCRRNVELQIDHIIPVSRGGSNEMANLQTLCGPCNRRKGATVG